MKTSHALIVCEDAIHGAAAAEQLQALGLISRVCSPTDVLAAPAEPPGVDLVCICHCGASVTQQVLAAVHIDRAETLTPTMVIDPPADDADSPIRLMPSAILPDLKLNEQVAALLAEAEQARRTGLRCDVHFRMANDCRWIDALSTKLQTLYRRFGVDPESDHRLTTAVREMVHNAVEWGNRGVADATVLVRCQIDSFAATILIRDSGGGFNRQQLPHAATSQDPTRHLHIRDEMGLRAGGFGILMTRGLVDDLRYNDAGNEVRIVKYFTRI